jgi:hypothetical protein
VFLLVLCLYTDGLFTSKSPLSFASISFILCINIFYSLYQYIYSLYQYILFFVSIYLFFVSIYLFFVSIYLFFVSISFIICFQSLLFIVSIRSGSSSSKRWFRIGQPFSNNSIINRSVVNMCWWYFLSWINASKD